MGAWDTGSFGNDDALDFVSDITGFAHVSRALIDAEASKGTLDAETANGVLAACDLLAASIGRPPEDIPDGAPRFKKNEVTDTLLKTARALVERVRTKSELTELWAEEEGTAWQDALDALILRLTPSAPYKAPPKKKRKTFPKDFLGHCYVCYGPVTLRDGILFEHTTEAVGTCATHPHRKCIEAKLPGPHWNEDGSPTEATRRQLLRDMGFDA